MLAKIENGAVVQYPYTMDQMRADHPNTSFPLHLTDDVLRYLGAARVVMTGQPEHDPEVESVDEALPSYDPGANVCRQTWSVHPL